MRIAIDMTGEVYGRLTVVKRHGIKNKVATWLCKCECGNQTVVKRTNLLSGTTRSCGCLQHESFVENGRNSVVHGHAAANTSTYKSWEAMRQRCNNPNHKWYHRYGGRGITICERWNDFRNFFDDMGPRPEGMTLDRKNVHGNYEPDNCRWATPTEQSLNRA